MMKLKKVIASVTFGTIAFCAASGAYAGSLTQPGETVGIALGAPLPEGVYFVDTGSAGGWRAVDDNRTTLGVNIPVIAWSTPWEFFGGRLEAYAAVPEIAYGGDGTPDVFGRSYTVMYNPFFTVGEAWDLGKVLSPGLEGWGFSTWVGGYAPSDSAFLGSGVDLLDEWVFNSRTALSYTGDKWNLTAHVIYGVTGTNLSNSLHILPDYLNYDLTAVKTLGKWSIGPVAFGSTDVGHCGVNTAAGLCQSQFAVGGLVGYDFTGISLQFYGTKDVFSENYFSHYDSLNPWSVPTKNYETRLWTRVIIPLWSPPAEAPLK